MFPFWCSIWGPAEKALADLACSTPCSTSGEVHMTTTSGNRLATLVGNLKTYYRSSKRVNIFTGLLGGCSGCVHTRGLKLKFIGGPHYREKNASRAAVYCKKKLLQPQFTKKPSKYATFDQTSNSCHFLRCSRAAQMHLAGRVFETPALSQTW